MIFYGTKTKEIATERLTDKCQNCGTQNSIAMHVFQKYAHVFWVPFFPLGKTGVSQCDHCKQVLKLKEMPSVLTTFYENLKGQNKTPIWMYSGLALTAILITIIFIAGRKNDEKNAQLILTPQSGDIFEIKTKENQYTLYKVDQVRGDSVYIQINKYEVNKSSGLSDLKRKDNNSYDEEEEVFTKSELKEMLSKGEILDIDRK